MQRSNSGSLSKLSGVRQRPGRASSRPAIGTSSRAVLVVGVIGPAAWLLAGCSSSGADLMSTVALPSQQTAGTDQGIGLGVSPDAGPQSSKLDLTPAQRGYLDALVADGVRPSSELRALSIGSYVCQARAAGQNDQAVRDFVAPMVRSDVADANASAPQSGSVIGADAAIDDYIRLAGLRLC